MRKKGKGGSTRKIVKKRRLEMEWKGGWRTRRMVNRKEGEGGKKGILKM